MAGEYGHSWDIPAKNHFGVMDWRGIPPPQSILQPIITPLTFPTIVNNGSSGRRSFSSLSEETEQKNGDNRKTSEDQEEEIVPQVASKKSKKAKSDSDVTYYHPTVNKQDIVLLEENGKLVNHRKIRGNNRLRVLLHVSKQKDLNEYQQSCLAEQIVQVIREDWKGNIYYCVPETKHLLRLKTKVTDEDDAYEAMLLLVEQNQDDLSVMFEEWKVACIAKQRSNQRLTTAEGRVSHQANPTSSPPLNSDSGKKRRISDISTASTSELKRQKEASKGPSKEGTPQEKNNDGISQATSSFAQESSFLPPDYIKGLSDMREAAIASLKYKQERDLAYGRRDNTRMALLASQHDLIGTAHLPERSFNPNAQNKANQGESTLLSSPQPVAPSTAPPWRELSALEALCSMVSRDSPSQDGENSTGKPVSVEGDSSGNKKPQAQCSEQDGDGSTDPPSPQQDSNGRPKPEKAWNVMFQRLCKYKEAFGDCLVPYSWEHDRKLGDWVSVQRKRYKKGLLQRDRTERLEAVGFVWALRQQEPWDSMFDRLVEFKRLHGHLVVPLGYKPFPKLARWVVDQRNHIRRGKLAKRRAEKLESIGFLSKACEQKSEASEQITRCHAALPPLLPKPSPMPAQEVQQVEAENFNTDTVVTNNEEDEGSWHLFENIRSDVGLWDERMFHRLLVYRQANGHCYVPENYKHDPFLGRWVSAVRSNKELLPLQHVRKLESIGFVFSVLQQLPWDNMVQRLQLAGSRTAIGHF